MNEEIVTALVHSPKKDKKSNLDVISNADSTKQQAKKPSRRWLLLELDRTQKKNAELVKQLQTRDDLERSLIESKTKLERDVALLKSRRVTGSHENEAIRERNKQLSQDVFLMKKILVKLNAELEWYQDKLRRCENELREAGKEIKAESPGKKKSVERQWLDSELSLFAPLVNAFEESLHEKEQLIRDLREALQQFSAKTKEIVAENSQLREKLNDSEKKGDVNDTDWISAQRELALTSEQNTLLRRQVSLIQSKISQLKVAFETKLGEVIEERDDSNGKLAALREEHLILKGKHSNLEKEHQQLRFEAADRIPKSVHSSYITECKRLLDELKARHEQERATLMKKQCTHESDIESSQENSKIRDLTSRLEEMEAECARAERRRRDLKARFDGLVTFSKELIFEYENLLQVMGGELGMKTGLNSRLDSIRKQLQGVESQTREEIKLLDEDIAAQMEKVNRQSVKQRTDIERLKQQLILNGIQPSLASDFG